MLLVDEPGIGKTRTLEELAEEARGAGAEVLVGRCYEGEGAPAFWPWVQVLRVYGTARDPATLARELGAAAPEVVALCPELSTRLPDVRRSRRAPRAGGRSRRPCCRSALPRGGSPRAR